MWEQTLWYQSVFLWHFVLLFIGWCVPRGIVCVSWNVYRFDDKGNRTGYDQWSSDVCLSLHLSSNYTEMGWISLECNTTSNQSLQWNVKQNNTEGIYANLCNSPTGVGDFLNGGDDVADLGIDTQGPIPEVERLTSEVHVWQVCAKIPDDVVYVRGLETTMVTGDDGKPVYRAVLQFLLDNTVYVGIFAGFLFSRISRVKSQTRN